MKKIPGKKNSRTKEIINPNEKTNDKRIRWLFCCLIFLYAACTQDEVKNNITENEMDYRKNLSFRYQDSVNDIENIIETGYIITRTGNDFTSNSLRSLNRRDKTFSHCGIACREGDSVFVYHAIGGEWNPDEKIKKEEFKSFVSAFANNNFGVFYFDDSILNRKNLIDTAYHWFKNGVKFDMEFDLRTDDRMYCAEFVAKSLECASPKTIKINRSKLKDFEFIGVDDIFLNSKCKKICEMKYK